MRKQKGISIHIGVNRISTVYHDQWFAELTVCEADAIAMKKVAEKMNFEGPEPILSKDATLNRIREEIEYAIEQLRHGDILFLSYSGHGMQFPKKNDNHAVITKEASQVEAWVLYDGRLVNDELYELCGKFHEGVRIVVVSDCCNSGTIMSKTVELKAHLLLISACSNGQVAVDGNKLSLFTGCLLKVWANGTFSGTYYDMYNETVNLMQTKISSKVQRPQYHSLGRGLDFGITKLPFSI